RPSPPAHRPRKVPSSPRPTRRWNPWTTRDERLREEKSTAVTRVGFVGAGRMGGPMVRRLVESGHDVRALGRTDGGRQAVSALGAQAVAGLHDIARDADVLIVCVFTDEQVAQVCAPGVLAAMSPGAALVIHTTGVPRPARVVAAHSPAIDVLDAPVSGGPHNVADGAITLFVGGPDDAVSR